MIDEKQVFFYSEKYAMRARAQRNEHLEKAQKMIDNPTLLKQYDDKGVAKYILKLEVDPDTGEVSPPNAKAYLNSQRILEEAQYDGYYCVTTSELDRKDHEIMDLYKGLWKIEESFRITKSELKSRPVFLSTDEHINAHFLACFISLLMTRILELKTGNMIPVNQLLDALRKANGVKFDTTKWVFGYYTQQLKLAGEAVGIDFSHKFRNTKEILTLKKEK